MSLTWYGNKELVWGDDTGVPLDLHMIRIRYFFIWDSNVGKPDVLKLPYVMPLGLIMRIADFLNIPFSSLVFERILIYGVFTGAGLSMYYLSMILGFEERRKQIGAIAASIFYMFNFYTMTTILPSGAMIMFEYAFFPLVLALYVKALNDGSPFKQSLVVALVWTLLITPAYITVSIAMIDWIVILICFLFYNLVKHDRRALINSLIFTSLLAMTWVLFNLFWIVPLLSAVPTILQSYGSLASGFGLYAINSAQLVDGLRLMGYWGLTSSFRGAHYYPWYVQFQNLPFVLLSFLPPLVVGFSLVLNSHRNKNVIFFGILSIWSLFMLKGLNPPFGNVNAWLFSLNLLSVAFRSSYQRFAGHLALCYAFLIGAFFSRICSRPIKNTMLNIARATGVLLILVLVSGVLAWPIWNGEVFSTEGIIPSKRVTVPSYYYEAAKWLNQQNEEFSVIPFPYPAKTAFSVLWWQNGTEGYYGVYPLLLLSPKIFLVTNSAGEAFVRTLVSGELKDARVLNYVNVKYLVVHWDADWPFIEDHPWWISTSPQNLRSCLENVRGLVLEKSFGGIEFYRNLYWSPERVRVIPRDEYLNTSLSNLIPIIGEGSFEKRMEIEIQQEDVTEIRDASVPMNVTYQSGMSSDFGNILFTFFNESIQQETKIPYWIESKKASEWAMIWAKIPFLEGNKTCKLFMYYGGVVHPESDSTAFFTFFDDFEEDGFDKWAIAEDGWKKDDYVKAEENFSARAQGGPSLLITDGSYMSAIFEGFFRFGEENVNHYPFVSNDNTGNWNYWIVAKQDGRFGHFDGEGYKDYPIVTQYYSNVWYQIKLAVDFQKQKYWVWINDTLVTPSGLPTRNAQGKSGTGLINWRLLNVGDRQNGTMWIDALKVYKQADLNFSFTLGIVQSVWSSDSSSISCVKISPTEYRVTFNASEPSYVLLAEPYDDGWIMTLSGNNTAADHFYAMGSLNGWTIEPQENSSATLIYVPQRTFDNGLIISLTSFVLVVALLAAGITKRLHWPDRMRKNRDSSKYTRTRDEHNVKIEMDSFTLENSLDGV